MRTPPTKDDRDDVERLNAEKWQLDLLKLNPSYPHWGPHEDYMWVKGEGWNAPIFYDTWKDMTLVLDELNEVVHFYFEVARSSKKCEPCDATGYSPRAKEVSDDFYDFQGTGRRWCDKITLDEVQALVEHHRLSSWDGSKWVPRAVVDDAFVAEVNAANKRAGMGNLSHDAINRGILIEQRCKRLGITRLCPVCDGHGYVHTAPAAHVQLVMWLLHPRKGCSRGVEVKLVERAELPAVFAFLKGAADRNAERFAKVAALV